MPAPAPSPATAIRVRLGIPLLLATVVCAPSPARAQNLDMWTPFLLLSPWIDGDLSLGRQVADSVRAAIRRTVPPRELWVVSNRDIESALTDAPDSMSYSDVRELGMVTHADAIISVGATRTSTGIHLAPSIMRGRRGDPEPLDPIDAANVRRAAELLARRILADSSLRRSVRLARARHPRVFTLGAPGAPPTAVFAIYEDKLFTHTDDQVGLLSATSSCIATRGHSATVTALGKLSGFLDEWIAQSAARVHEPPPGVMTTLTTDTMTISGILATRVHVTNAGDFRSDIWFASSILPEWIRTGVDRWRTGMPADFWRLQHQDPTLTELTFTYGVPLRIQSPDGQTLNVTLSDSLPRWTAGVERACGA